MTVDPARFCGELVESGLTFVAGVPDSLLKEFCASLDDAVAPGADVIAPNEGAALALAAGFHLATGRCAAVYLQNSGLGNLVNPLLSLVDADVYSIPVVVIVGWRGEPGVADEPQHRRQGGVTPALLDAMGYPHRTLARTDEGAADDLRWAVGAATDRSSPVFLLVGKDTFSPGPAVMPHRAEPTLTRRDAIESIVDVLGTRAAIVATTGMIGRELLAVRIERGESSDSDFLVVGSMGHASSIALGVALGRPNRQVVCLDGDGAMLMHLGAVPVIGQVAPPNLAHVVLNNGAHDSVGGQPTAGFDVDLTAIAGVCGYRTLDVVTDPDHLRAAAAKLAGQRGPVLLEVRVRRGARPDVPRPTATPLESKTRFMAAMRDGDPGRVP